MKMKITNKKRNLIKYANSVRVTTLHKGVSFFADNRLVINVVDDRRVETNIIKRKHGIPQRWAVLMVISEDGERRYLKWAKKIHGYRIYRGHIIRADFERNMKTGNW